MTSRTRAALAGAAAVGLLGAATLTGSTSAAFTDEGTGTVTAEAASLAAASGFTCTNSMGTSPSTNNTARLNWPDVAGATAYEVLYTVSFWYYTAVAAEGHWVDLDYSATVAAPTSEITVTRYWIVPVGVAPGHSYTDHKVNLTVFPLRDGTTRANAVWTGPASTTLEVLMPRHGTGHLADQAQCRTPQHS